MAEEYRLSQITIGAKDLWTVNKPLLLLSLLLLLLLLLILLLLFLRKMSAIRR